MTTKHTPGPCRHDDVTTGPVYQHCEECGAVRVRPDLRPTDGAWHTCAECDTRITRLALARAKGGAS